MNLGLHIETIVIDRALATTDQADLVRVAIADEVLRLVRLHGVPPALATGGGTPVLDGEARGVRPGLTSTALGAGIGRAVHGSLASFVPPTRDYR